MAKAFLILFIVIPAIELYVLIEVGSIIGGLVTILMVFLTAFFGVALMRGQGMATMQKAQSSLQAGLLPQTEMIEGVFIFLGGVLLLIPGFITDSLGLLFLVPPIRQALANNAIKYKKTHPRGDNVYEAEWTEQSEDGQIKGYMYYESNQEKPDLKKENKVIDADFEELDKKS